MKNRNSEYNCIFYLISCALNDVIPDKEIIDRYSMQNILTYSAKHSISALVGYSLMKNEAFESSPLCGEWSAAINNALRNTILMDAEREEIYSYMEQNGVWHIPLKGIVLKEYYPEYGIREMSDNDILYDARHQELMRQYMTGNGYDAVSVGIHQDDIYHKLPIYNFELHRTLFRKDNTVLYKYFYRVKHMVERLPGSRYSYQFKREYFYIYVLAHAYTHYHLGGTGIRSLVDIYLYYNTEKDMDRALIGQELRNIGLYEFHKKCVSISSALFGDAAVYDLDRLSDSEWEFLSYIIDSGTYGTYESDLKNIISRFDDGYRIKRSSVYKYYLTRMFPDLTYIRSNAPVVYKYKALIPLFYLYRFVKLAFYIPRTVKEIRYTHSLIGKEKLK